MDFSEPLCQGNSSPTWQRCYNICTHTGRYSVDGPLHLLRCRHTVEVVICKEPALTGNRTATAGCHSLSHLKCQQTSRTPPLPERHDTHNTSEALHRSSHMRKPKKGSLETRKLQPSQNQENSSNFHWQCEVASTETVWSTTRIEQPFWKGQDLRAGTAKSRATYQLDFGLLPIPRLCYA